MINYIDRHDYVGEQHTGLSGNLSKSIRQVNHYY